MRVTLFSMPLVYENRDKGSKSLLKDRRTTDFCINHQLPRAVQISLRLSLERANKPAYLPGTNWDSQMNLCVWSFRFVSHFLWILRSTSRKWKDTQPQHVLGWRHENLPFTLFSLVINCYIFENTKEVWCIISEALLTSFPQVLNLSRCLSHYANFDIQQTNGRVAMNERIRSFAFDR